MPETLFISDLHLDPQRPEVIDLLVRFLDGRAAAADALYILGDLFEYWIGDDDVRADLLPAVEALRRLSDAGVPVWFMAGNRDFLVGEGFAARTGCRLLEDPTRTELYGVPTLLMHGDSLCIDDIEYQALRKQLRDPAWQTGFLSLPVEQRRAQAEALRRQSREATRDKAAEIMDVNAAEVDAVFREYGVRRIIHGHTHRPAVHSLSVDGEPAERIVLGDWYNQGSVLSVTPAGYGLEELRTD